MTDLPNIETLANAHPERTYEIELEALEFTSRCPLTGGPDFGRLTIIYVPAEKLLELKSLRDFLSSYRERRVLQEAVVNEVLDAIVAAAAPRFAEVIGDFNARGGITARVTASTDQEQDG
jgi:7-cyano-7-deazaguanine reductase